MSVQNCGECSKPMTVPDAKIEMVNAGSVSAIVWAHPDPVVCPHCGTRYVGYLSTAPRDIQIGFMKLPPESKIVPPNGFRP